MDFILGQLRQLGLVAVTMLCAAGGTAGILKLIKRFAPGIVSLKDPISKKLGENSKEEG